MTTVFAAQHIPPGPRRRHQARVEKFSADIGLLEQLDGLSVSDEDVPEVVLSVCSSFGVEAPRLKFHARRSPYTGATEQPRWLLVVIHGEDRVSRIESGMAGSVPAFGAIRLGRTTTLMTLAHELGHHLVFALDPHSTPSHGKRWVNRFDGAAREIARLI